MIVDFYYNIADNRKVNKLSELTLIASLPNINFKLDENRNEPQLELAYNSDIVNANYCYIHELNYYYFMSEPILSTQRLIFNCTTDLLMTYKDEILQLGCIISRQENKYNAYLRDNRYPVLNKQAVTTIAFPNGFSNSEEMLLVVNGGGN